MPHTAATASETASTRHPNDVDAWRRRIRADTFSRYHYQMAIALEAEGSHAAAIEAYRRALQDMPGWTAASVRLMEALERADRADEAARVRSDAEAQDPDCFARAQMTFVEDDIAANRTGSALTRLRALRESKPGWVEDLGPLFEALGSHLLAQAGADLPRQAEAIAIFQEAVACASGLCAAHRKIGVYSIAQREFEQAVVHLQAAFALEPRRTEIFEDLMWALLVARRYEEIERLCLRMFESLPDYWYSRTCLGIARQIRGDGIDALTAYQEGVARAGSNAMAQVFQGFGLLAVGRVDEAVTLASRVAEANPGLHWAPALKGLALIAARRPAEALAGIETAMQRLPFEFGMLRIAAGLALDQLGRAGEADASYRAATIQDPASITFYRDLVGWEASLSQRMKAVASA